MVGGGPKPSLASLMGYTLPKVLDIWGVSFSLLTTG